VAKNMGGLDRVVRAILGVAILGLGLSRGAWWGWIGLIPLGTALMARCPAYMPFGISTCRSQKPAA
jgi:Inner membrane protein YgaP-like, transmembrane domain